jgi:hypothetical protein
MCFFADIAEPLLFAVVRERRITALLDDSEPISVLKKGGMGCYVAKEPYWRPIKNTN